MYNDLNELDHQMLLDEAKKMRELLHAVNNAENPSQSFRAIEDVAMYLNSLPR